MRKKKHLPTLTAREICKSHSSFLFAGNESSSVYEILKHQIKTGNHISIFCQGDKPTGFITDEQIAELVKKGENIWAVKAADIAVRRIKTVDIESDISGILRHFNRSRTYPVIVTNSDGSTAGIITYEDLEILLHRQFAFQDNEGLDRHTYFRGMINFIDRERQLLEDILTASLQLGIISTDPDMKVIYYNKKLSDMIGRKNLRLSNRNIFDIFAAWLGDPDKVPNATDIARIKGESTTKIRIDEHDFHLKVVYNVKKKAHSGFIFILKSLDEEANSLESIRKLAYYDTLTGLPNRFFLDERLNLEILRGERDKIRFTLTLMDIDNFKMVNDTLGHVAGDRLLQTVSQRIKSAIRATDMVARIGGDEFILLFSGLESADKARKVITKLLGTLSEPYSLDGSEMQATFSFGIAIYPDNGRDALGLIKCADLAMYQAKETGRLNGKSNIAVAQAERCSQRLPA